VPEGESFAVPNPPVTRTIQHVFLSHPHQDHGSDLDEVLDCYQVAHLWEPGVVNDAGFHLRYIQAVARESGLHYHTVRAPEADRIVRVDGTDVTIPDGITWTEFGEGEHEELGFGAFFDVLFADGTQHSDFNQNSLVVRVQLGDKSLLLTGDPKPARAEGCRTTKPRKQKARCSPDTEMRSTSTSYKWPTTARAHRAATPSSTPSPPSGRS
jgi:hypothetical protein